MAAKGDYIMVSKVASPPKTTIKRTDMYKIVAKVYVIAKAYIRLIYIIKISKNLKRD